MVCYNNFIRRCLMRILIVEDEPDLLDALKKQLQSSGYSVDGCGNGLDAEDYLKMATYDAVVLDIMLPGIDGLTLLKKMRAEGNTTHVLLLTALDSIENKVNGLDAGADDYLIKPYDLDELSARIRALLRRSAGRSDPIIRRGRLTINPSTREVLFNGESVLLSSKEYALLFALAERPGIVLSRAQLEEKLYNYESLIGSNAIEVHIHHLRKKLSEDSIKTVRGVGYVLET